MFWKTTDRSLFPQQTSQYVQNEQKRNTRFAPPNDAISSIDGETLQSIVNDAIRHDPIMHLYCLKHTSLIDALNTLSAMICIKPSTFASSEPLCHCFLSASWHHADGWSKEGTSRFTHVTSSINSQIVSFIEFLHTIIARSYTDICGNIAVVQHQSSFISGTYPTQQDDQFEAPSQFTATQSDEKTPSSNEAPSQFSATQREEKTSSISEAPRNKFGLWGPSRSSREASQYHTSNLAHEQHASWSSSSVLPI